MSEDISVWRWLKHNLCYVGPTDYGRGWSVVVLGFVLYHSKKRRRA